MFFFFLQSENNLREDFVLMVKSKLDKFKEKNPSLGEVVFIYFI